MTTFATMATESMTVSEMIAWCKAVGDKRTRIVMTRVHGFELESDELEYWGMEVESTYFTFTIETDIGVSRPNWSEASVEITSPWDSSPFIYEGDLWSAFVQLVAWFDARDPEAEYYYGELPPAHRAFPAVGECKACAAAGIEDHYLHFTMRCYRCDEIWSRYNECECADKCKWCGDE